MSTCSGSSAKNGHRSTFHPSAVACASNFLSKAGGGDTDNANGRCRQRLGQAVRDGQAQRGISHAADRSALL